MVENDFAKKYWAKLAQSKADHELRGSISKMGTKKVGKVMREYKHGELHSGSKNGPRVKSRAQAIAIALNEARNK